MCDYSKLQRAKLELLNTLDILLNDAETYYELENNAATNIQRVFRGNKVRDRVAIMSAACSEIERVFRGHMGRNAYRIALQAKKDNIQFIVFEYFSLQVQKIFRGYYSRKYRKNHANRKKYLAEVSEKGDRVRRMLEEYSIAQSIREAEEARTADAAEFRSAAENLHHLLGTAQIRGVFNPPEQYLKTPTVDGLPIETHLRGAVKDLLRSRGIAKKGGLVVDMNGSRRVPYKGLKSRLSVQASAQYGILDEQRTRDRVLHSLLTLDRQHAFVAGGDTKVLKSRSQPLAVGDPFMDQYRNPLVVRGVPRDQKQLNESAVLQKSLFAVPPEKPFYLATGGNKSSVLPSGVFDVIADAELAGGNTKRHKSTTKRFGLPDSADNREGMATALPARTTSLRMNIKKRQSYKVTGHVRVDKANYDDLNESSDDEDNDRDTFVGVESA